MAISIYTVAAVVIIPVLSTCEGSIGSLPSSSEFLPKTISRVALPETTVTISGREYTVKRNMVTIASRDPFEAWAIVKDGQTLVLGGIYVVDKAERESRTPFLHKIPFIGNAFKSNEYRDSRQELLIFVTPRIIQTTDAAS